MELARLGDHVRGLRMDRLLLLVLQLLPSSYSQLQEEKVRILFDSVVDFNLHFLLFSVIL